MLAALLATVLLAAQGPSPKPMGCSGVDPELLAFSARNVMHAGKYDRYTLTVEIKNAGATAEPTNFPQEIDIFLDGHPAATIPVPGLSPGQGRTVTTVIEVPQTERHPVFVARLVDGEARLPAPKRCKVQRERLELHV